MDLSLLNEVVHLRPFLVDPITHKDGMCTPLHIDIAALLATPVVFERLLDETLQKINKSEYDVIVGSVTLGLPLATGIALRSRTPLAWVRKHQKGYSENRVVEGVIRRDSRVLIVDDFFITGGTVSKIIHLLRTAGVHAEEIFVLGILSEQLLFAWQRLQPNVRVHYLFTSLELILIAVEQNILSPDFEMIYRAFLEDPYCWKEDAGTWEQYLICKESYKERADLMPSKEFVNTSPSWVGHD